MLKLIVKLSMWLLASMSLSLSAHAQVPSDKQLAVHIAGVHYKHPTILFFPYVTIWQMQGPLVEAVAMSSLTSLFSNVSECRTDAAKDANLVMLLQPHLFYNPQSAIYYAKLTASVYGAQEQVITSITKEARVVGPVNINPDLYSKKVYSKAIDHIIEALKTDVAFLSALKEKTPINTNQICNNLDNIPTNRFYY
ncbi:MAG: hypothetical protein KFB94_02085 [Methylophilaceae bacterium]|nr:MAG: hypothetical protein KFB94_02085 [Methylophilaceae bacterium]